MDSARNAGKIKCMQRLAKIKHYIIGDIHNCTDTAHATVLKALYHPDWSNSTSIDTADDEPAITRTRDRGFHCNFYAVCNRCRDVRDFHLRQGTISNRGNFTRDTENTQAVTAVRRRLYGKYL